MKEARLGDEEDEDADLLGLAGGLLDTPLSADVKEDVDALLGNICSYQLQALYEMEGEDGGSSPHQGFHH